MAGRQSDGVRLNQRAEVTMAHGIEAPKCDTGSSLIGQTCVCSAAAAHQRAARPPEGVPHSAGRGAEEQAVKAAASSAGVSGIA